MAIHTPTMFLVIIVASFMLAGAIAFIAHGRHRNLFLWSTALAIQGLAYTLISLRGQVSDVVSIVLGNLALSSTFALLGEGLFQFQKRPPPRWLLWGPVALVTVSFAVLQQDLQTRLLLGGVIYPLQGGVVLAALLQRRHETPGRGQYILASGMLVVIAMLAFRLLFVLTGQAQINSFAESSPVQAFTFTASLVGMLWLSIGLVTMNQERAEHAVQVAQHLERFRGQVLEQLASGADLPMILRTLATGIERLHPGMLCSIHLLDRAGRHLVDGVAPSLPDFFNAASNGLAIGAGVGSCGAAAHSGQRVVVDRIAEHPNWAPFKALAAQAGVDACWSQPILSAHQQVLGTFAIYHRAAHTPSAADIALIEQCASLASIAIERSREAKALRLSEERYRRLVDAADEGIGVAQDGVLRFTNPKLQALVGYRGDELLGRAFLEFVHPDDRAMVLSHYQKRLAGQSDGLKYAVRLQTRHQGVRWFEMSGTAFEWDDRPATLNFLTDITERRRMEERVQRMAYHDALTQLPNRHLLTDRLGLAMARHKRSGRYGALMFLDLDNFKALNDRHGHDVGDLLLVEVARRLNGQVRETDTVARFGGDEFVVMLGDLDESEPHSRELACGVAEKIRQALAEPYRLRKRQGTDTGNDTVIEHRCSASIGLVLFLSQAGSENSLLEQADAAMYQAKQAGRDTLRVVTAGA